MVGGTKEESSNNTPGGKKKDKKKLEKYFQVAERVSHARGRFCSKYCLKPSPLIHLAKCIRA